MRVILLIVIFAMLSSCYNTTKPMAVLKTTLPEKKFKTLSINESKSTFALAKLIADIDRGETIFAFPAKPTTKGMLCNSNITGDGEVTYSGGKKYLGDWSTELGDIFYETLTKLGYDIAGDPTDLFNASATVATSEYLIGGRVNKIAGNFCEEHDFWSGYTTNKFSGEMSVTLEWSVLNTLTKSIVIKETTTGYFKLDKPEKEGITTVFESAFANAADAFAKTRDLRRIAVGKKIISTENTTTGNYILIDQGKSQNKFDIQKLRENIATIRIGQGHGSGFFIGKNGYLLTNAHVVGNANNVQVITAAGIEIKGEVIRKNKARDVALIKVPFKLANALFLKLKKPNIADEVYAVGTPMKEALKTTVTKGIISNIRTDPASNLEFIQSDASISPGNSGGPLFDEFGNVIGISVAKFIGNNSEGLGLFIPLKDAFNYIELKIN